VAQLVQYGTFPLQSLLLLLRVHLLHGVRRLAHVSLVGIRQERAWPGQGPKDDLDVNWVKTLHTYVLNIYSRIPGTQPQEHEYRIPPV